MLNFEKWLWEKKKEKKEKEKIQIVHHAIKTSINQVTKDAQGAWKEDEDTTKNIQRQEHGMPIQSNRLFQLNSQ